MEDFPVIPKDLLEALEKKFPDKCPSINMTDREIWRNVGSVEVVRHLRFIYNEQNKNIMR